jgi:ferrochelatase
MIKKTNIIICQLGSPKSTKIKDVRSYLREFLSDERVIDTPRIIWFFVLNLFILPFRPKSSAAAYKRIEFCNFLPLIEITKKFVKDLQSHLPDHKVYECFLLSEPRLGNVITLEKLEAGEQFLFIPQFPQFSDTTTSSCLDQLRKHTGEYYHSDQIQIINNFHNLKAFIDLSVININNLSSKYCATDVVISFHGIPVRYVTQKKDIYYKHCLETFELLKRGLNYPSDRIHLTFQSRLGSEEWLSPYTDEYVEDLVTSGTKNIAIYCPSFVSDCLETTDEIGTELGEVVEELGGELTFVPCLNNDPNWTKKYAEYISAIINDKPIDDLIYDTKEIDLSEKIDAINVKDNSLTPKAKKTIKIVFLTLFLDLIGFSIIFPMFPALAKYYIELDPNNYFLKLIFGSITSLTQASGSSMSSIVLFGGALGALYSLLQFFAAPLWGGISDKYGRKPILLVSVFGLFLSYVLWFFSGSFTLLIVARIVGGVMGGNLSTASAAVADVTTRENRSKGMAFVGIAFALGFIFGPALGGILTMFNPLDLFPQYESIGVNPFSYAALLAAVLSLINFFYILFKFEETVDPSAKHHKRSSNILKLLKPLPYRDVNLTNYSYFLFISAFSGMEFTLTFLAVERMSFTSMDNAYMFIFIGFIIAMVQGGYVRRKANQIGEKKMAIQGLISIIPGLLLIAYAQSHLLLYMGLFFLAVGSAMAIPTLTSLVSLNTPTHEQGQSIGIFRSLGSLGRVIGPVFASVIYWKMGSHFPYILGSIFIILPIIILSKVDSK